MKTCLISQINYIGCFLPVPDTTLGSLQQIIDGFVLKNLPVSADHLYLPAEYGGLGIFNIKKFLTAQHCSWILRAYKLPIDNWRFDLRAAAPAGEIYLIRKCDLIRESNPILINLVSSFEIFYGEFSKKDGNYKNAYIFSNQAFTRGADSQLLLDSEFFGCIGPAPIPLRKLKFRDRFSAGTVKNIADFRLMGIELSPATWFRLQSALLLSRQRLRKPDDSENLSEPVKVFLNRVKKGSKKFRVILEAGDTLRSNPSLLRTVNTYSALTNCPVPDMT